MNKINGYKTWRAWARTLDDIDVIQSYANEMIDYCGPIENHEKFADEQLSEFAKIMKSKRTHAHANIIRKSWGQRKQLRVIICNITFNGVSSRMSKAMREHNKEKSNKRLIC